ncbi:hypothetical protein D623_10022150 [Myotis brandtii]|uniref:Uncharacterized protein n=1 Tax=Myotis brandtii TaxID=109478 RepID=S7Q1F5_MYOBR|nr:hypothetical protein D623_10022150 [Myotis brandtii]
MASNMKESNGNECAVAQKETSIRTKPQRLQGLGSGSFEAWGSDLTAAVAGSGSSSRVMGVTPSPDQPEQSVLNTNTKWKSLELKVQYIVYTEGARVRTRQR